MIAYLITAAVTIPLVLCLSVIYAIRQGLAQSRKDHRCLRYRPYTVVVGAIGACVSLFSFAGVLILFRKDSEILFPLAMFSSMLVLSLYLLLSALNWQLELGEEGLVYRNRLRITKRISYQEIDCFSIHLTHDTTHRPHLYVIEAGDTKIKLTEDDVEHFRPFGQELTERMHKLGSRRGIIKIHDNHNKETIPVGGLSDAIPEILTHIFSDLFFS